MKVPRRLNRTFDFALRYNIIPEMSEGREVAVLTTAFILATLTPSEFSPFRSDAGFASQQSTMTQEEVDHQYMIDLEAERQQQAEQRTTERHAELVLNQSTQP